MKGFISPLFKIVILNGYKQWDFFHSCLCPNYTFGWPVFMVFITQFIDENDQCQGPWQDLRHVTKQKGLSGILLGGGCGAGQGRGTEEELQGDL